MPLTLFSTKHGVVVRYTQQRPSPLPLASQAKLVWKKRMKLGEEMKTEWMNWYRNIEKVKKPSETRWMRSNCIHSYIIIKRGNMRSCYALYYFARQSLFLQLLAIARIVRKTTLDSYFSRKHLFRISLDCTIILITSFWAFGGWIVTLRRTRGTCSYRCTLKGYILSYETLLSNVFIIAKANLLSLFSPSRLIPRSYHRARIVACNLQASIL